MVLNYFRCIVFGGLLVACGSTTQDEPSATVAINENEPLPIEEARTVYTLNCASCHGQDGAAQISNAADLSKSTMDAATIEKTIRKGNDKGMMPYEELLTVGEIKGLVAFVETLRKK